ncbi:ABC transporter permease [Guggenheimella bovis]
MNKHVYIVIGSILIGLLLFMCLLSFVWLPYPPNDEVAEKYLPPSGDHWFGTDDLGRDLLSRVLVGSRNVFYVGMISVSIGLVGGILIGGIAGFLGGAVDSVLMLIMDAFMSFPGILFALMYVAVFGYGIKNTVIALGIMAIPVFSRITRTGFLQERQKLYVKLAQSVGVGRLRIMFVHILPNIMTQLTVAVTMGFASAILNEAGLSYLGLGVQPPDPSWGRMLKESQNVFVLAPHYALIPGLMITLAVLGFNLFGDGIRDLKEYR